MFPINSNPKQSVIIKINVEIKDIIIFCVILEQNIPIALYVEIIKNTPT
tara:strand:+ start:906 stop:1052 length:147 start_codon:yes stop_codon:yes gene_type:complete